MPRRTTSMIVPTGKATEEFGGTVTVVDEALVTSTALEASARTRV